MMELAPIILFVYNRPVHTRQTLEALAANDLAAASTLYIFCDGPKQDAGKENLDKISEVRRLIREKLWCKNVIIREQEKNKGLASSIIDGVTEIVNQYGKVIVLEDDLVTAPKFLTYMNDGLSGFSEYKEVGAVCAYWDNRVRFPGLPHFFVLNGADCWGWGTWSDRWKNFIPDAAVVKDRLIREKKMEQFDFGNMQSILDSQIKGLVNSWHIRWHGTQILFNKVALFPATSFVKNIGVDGSGTHGPVTLGESINDRFEFNDYKTTLQDFDFNTLKAAQLKIENKIRKMHINLSNGPSTLKQKFKNFLRKIKEI